MCIPHPTSKSKLFSSESWFSISQLVSASNPSPHHYCGTSTGGLNLISFHHKYTWQKRTGTTDCIPGDYLFIWYSICSQPWIWKIFIWLWMIRYNGKKRGSFSNPILILLLELILSNLLPQKNTWPWRCVCQNTHSISPFTKIRADSILKKPFEMLIQCLIPLSCPLLNTKSILNYSIRYLV